LVKEAGDWVFYYTWLCYSVAEVVQKNYESNKSVFDLLYEDFYVPIQGVTSNDTWLAALLGQYAAGKRGWHYLYCLLQNWEISIEEVLLANEAKLAERHPNGWQGGKKEN
jgi:hypothetical protein